MRKIGIILASAALLFVGAVTVLAGDKVISSSELPQSAQQFVKTYFAGKDPVVVKMDRDGLSKEYEVVFADGSKAEFDGKGAWKEVQSVAGISSDIVPARILSQLKTGGYMDGGVKVVKIERDNKGYDLELSSGMEFEFNKNMQLVDIDR